MYKVNVVKANGKIILPSYETLGASGLDVRAYEYSLVSDPGKNIKFNEEGFILEPHQRVLIKTGLFIELPENTEIQVRARGGLALRHGITLANSIGTVDEDYRGEIGVILINTSDTPYTIKKNDRIAQLVLAKVEKFEWNETGELSNTKRAKGAYSSTGIN